MLAQSGRCTRARDGQGMRIARHGKCRGSAGIRVAFAMAIVPRIDRAAGEPMRSSSGFATASSRLTKIDATDAMWWGFAMTIEAAQIRPRDGVIVIEENISVMLMLRPSAVSVSTAGMPSHVSGTLTLGRATACQR